MHLTDCYAPLICYLVHFQRGARENPHDVEKLRAEIDLLLKQGEERALAGGIPLQSYRAAGFAVCAWVDEIILNSAWPEREGWLKEELQRRHYGTGDAGEEFFERLKDLPFHEHEVREVYYLCLSLGFTGRYCGAGGTEALATLRSAELQVLTGSCAAQPSEERDLFPGGYPQDLPAGRDTGTFSFRSVPVLTALTVPVLVFAALLVVFRFALGGMAENLLKTVPF